MLPECPYVGFAPFDKEDADFFFGRSQERRIIAANLRSSPLTVLYGPTGVGKTSVLRAGVIQDLRAETVRMAGNGRPDFIVVDFSTWHGDAVKGLSRAIVESVNRINPTFSSLTLPDSASLPEILRQYSGVIQAELLIVLDQFEEVFTYRDRTRDLEQFISEFPQTVRRAGLPVKFLISIREDAIAQLDVFKDDIPTLFDNWLRVEHLNNAAAEEAIRGPLEKYNSLCDADSWMGLQPQLVGEVIEKIQAYTSSFGPTGVRGPAPMTAPDRAHVEAPYLQLVMTRLWERESKSATRCISRRTLMELRGIGQIVSSHVDDTMGQLTHLQQRVAARFLDRLVTRRGTKVALAESELAYYAKVSVEAVRPVVDALCKPRVRLLQAVTTLPGQAEDRLYQIYHDLLGMPLLNWLARFRERQKSKRWKRARYAIGTVALIAVAALGVTLREKETQIDTLSSERDNLTSQRDDLTFQRDDLTFQRDVLTLIESGRSDEAYLKIQAALAKRSNDADVTLLLAAYYAAKGEQDAQRIVPDDREAAESLEQQLKQCKEILIAQIQTDFVGTQRRALHRAYLTLAQALGKVNGSEDEALRIFNESDSALSGESDPQRDGLVRKARSMETLGRTIMRQVANLPTRDEQSQSATVNSGRPIDKRASSETALRWYERAADVLMQLHAGEPHVAAARRDYAERCASDGGERKVPELLRLALRLTPETTSHDVKFLALDLRKAFDKLNNAEGEDDCLAKAARIARTYEISKSDSVEPYERQNISAAYDAIAGKLEASNDCVGAIEFYRKRLTNDEAWIAQTGPRDRQAAFIIGWSYIGVARNILKVDGPMAAKPCYSDLRTYVDGLFNDAKNDTSQQWSVRTDAYRALCQSPALTAAERAAYCERLLTFFESRADDKEQNDLATFYVLLAGVSSRIDDPLRRAHEGLMKELELREVLAKGKEPSDEANYDLGFVLEWLADVCLSIGKTGDAVTSGERSVQLYRERAKAPNGRRSEQERLSIGLQYLGNAQLQAGRIGDCLTSAEEVLTIAQAGPPASNSNKRASAYSRLATVELGLDRLREAHLHATLALQLRQEVVEASQCNEIARQELAAAQQSLGNELLKRGDRVAALSMFESARDIETKANDQDFREVKMRVARAEEKLADGYFISGRVFEALETYKAASPLRAQLSGDEQDIAAKRSEAELLRPIAKVCSVLGQVSGAQESARQSLDIEEDITARVSPEVPYNLQRVALAHESLGWVARAREDGQAAHNEFEAALKLRQALVDLDPLNASASRDLRRVLNALGDIASMQENVDLSQQYRDRAREIGSELDQSANNGGAKIVSVRERFERARDLGLRGELEMRRQDFESAGKWLQEGIAILDDLKMQELLVAQEHRDWYDDQLRLAEVCGVAEESTASVDVISERLVGNPMGRCRALAFRAMTMARRGMHDESKATAERIRELEPRSSAIEYELARCYAQCASIVQRGRARQELMEHELKIRDEYASQALHALQSADEQGFADGRIMAFDSGLIAIRQEPDYAGILRRVISREWPEGKIIQ